MQLPSQGTGLNQTILSKPSLIIKTFIGFEGTVSLRTFNKQLGRPIQPIIQHQINGKIHLEYTKWESETWYIFSRNVSQTHDKHIECVAFLLLSKLKTTSKLAPFRRKYRKWELKFETNIYYFTSRIIPSWGSGDESTISESLRVL